MEMPPVSNTADDVNSPDWCATDPTDAECPQAREPMFVHIARELEEDIKSRRIREILYIGAIKYLRLWLREQSPVANFEEMASAMGWDGSIGLQEESASAIGWKELIDLCLLAEIFDFDLTVIPIRVFRFKYRLEMMPDDLMAYIYKRTTKVSAFREAVIEEKIFQEKPLKVVAVGKPILYPRAFLLDLVQGQIRYYSRRGYHDDDKEDHEKEYPDSVTMHFQLVDKLKKLRKILNLAKGKGKVNSDIDEETEDEDSNEETEDEEMEDEEMEDDTDYEKDNKGHEMEVISQQEAEELLKSIAKLITK